MHCFKIGEIFLPFEGRSGVRWRICEASLRARRTASRRIGTRPLRGGMGYVGLQMAQGQLLKPMPIPTFPLKGKEFSAHIVAHLDQTE